mgnify:FL=1
MITGTIKDYTITTLQNILGILVIKKGIQTKEFKTLQGMNLHTNELDNINIHTSEGLHIKSLKTNWQWRYIQQKRMEPVNTMVTYTSQVHPDDIHKDIRNLTKQTLWEIITILSE